MASDLNHKAWAPPSNTPLTLTPPVLEFVDVAAAAPTLTLKPPRYSQSTEHSNEANANIDKADKLKVDIRAKVAHPFRVIKRQLGYVKVRHRGLKKNTAQLFTLVAQSNLWMARGKLMGFGAWVHPTAGQVTCER